MTFILFSNNQRSVSWTYNKNLASCLNPTCMYQIFYILWKSCRYPMKILHICTKNHTFYENPADMQVRSSILRKSYRHGDKILQVRKLYIIVMTYNDCRKSSQNTYLQVKSKKKKKRSCRHVMGMIKASRRGVTQSMMNNRREDE